MARRGKAAYLPRKGGQRMSTRGGLQAALLCALIRAVQRQEQAGSACYADGVVSHP